MSASVGISGMGRIGRLLVRRAFSSEGPNLDIKAINASYPAETIAHLLKYDTIHGKWNAEIVAADDHLIIEGKKVALLSERDPAQIPWKKYGIDLVIDATGKFNNREGASKHLQAGAQKVIITAPGKNMDYTVVMGVNDEGYDPEKHDLLSAASCTTNCVSPVLKILDDSFTIKSGWMTTVHAYTNDQNHLDNPHKDLRRARACTQSMIPTSTGVRKALADVLPHLSTRIQGLAVRVPTADVSLVDLTVQLERTVTVEEVREAFQTAAQGAMAQYVEYNEEPLVSSDYIGCAKSAVIDGLSLMAAGDQVKVLAWYDNEWGYACRVVDLAALVAGKLVETSPTSRGVVV